MKRLQRRGRVLSAGLGIAAILVLVTVGAGTAFANQPPTAAVEVTNTTVNTDGSWLVDGGPVTAVVECPYKTYTTDITSADWIWVGVPSCYDNKPVSAPNASHAFSTTFSVPGNVQSAELQYAADNGLTVYINGTLVANLTPTSDSSHFDQVHTANATAAVIPGTNTISITGTNIQWPGYNPGGVVASLTVTSALTSADLCKNGGWQNWTDPAFTSQGDCVSYVVSHGADPTHG